MVALGTTCWRAHLRIATYTHQGRRQVGLVSFDASAVTPIGLDAVGAHRGVLALIEIAATGAAWPPAAGAPIALTEVRLEAPLPLPRRNLFCVGRNYHAHARELHDTLFKD